MSDDRLTDMTIAQLRSMATDFNISFARDWKKTDFVRAIERRQNKKGNFVEIVEKGAKIPEGHARIKIIGTEETRHPALVRVNNYPCLIPIDVEVDIPLESLEALNNASRPRSVQVKDPESPTGKSREIKAIPTYNVQLIGTSNGVARYPNGKRKVEPGTAPEKMRLREKYREIYGRWPKTAEFNLWKEQHMLDQFKTKVSEKKDRNKESVADQQLREVATLSADSEQET